jgi:hypothetical protein
LPFLRAAPATAVSVCHLLALGAGGARRGRQLRGGEEAAGGSGARVWGGGRGCGDSGDGVQRGQGMEYKTSDTLLRFVVFLCPIISQTKNKDT